MKRKLLKKIALILLICTGGFLFASYSPSLDGRAVVVDEGVFPSGLFAKTVGYLPGDIITVTNINGDTTIDILVIGALDPSEGVAIMLSPEAAQAIGIDKEANNIVKITKRSNQDERVYGTAVIARQMESEETIPVSKIEKPEELKPIVDDEPDEIATSPAYEDPEENVVPEEENSSFTEEAPVEEPAEEAPVEEPQEETPVELEEDFSESYSDDYYEEDVVSEDTFDENKPAETFEEEGAEESEPEEEVPEETVEAQAYEEDEIPEDDSFESAESEEFTDEGFEDEPEETEESEEFATEEPAEEEPAQEEFTEEEVPPEEFTDEPLEEEAEDTFEETPAEEEFTEEEVPAEEEFAEDEFGEEAPPEDEFAEETPAEDEFQEEAPAEDEFAEEAPAEDEFAEETPAEEEFTEEAPAEETEEAEEGVIADENPEQYQAINLDVPEEVEDIPEETVEEDIPQEIEEPVVEPVIEPVIDEPQQNITQVPLLTGTSYDDYIVQSLDSLSDSSYYIQISVLKDDAKIVEIINKYGKNYPVVVVPANNGVKQILIGPLSVDEYGVVLERFKAYGYKDAFIKRKPVSTSVKDAK